MDQKLEIKTGITLEDLMRNNMRSRLGLSSTTFHPEIHRDSLPPPMEMGQRVSVGQGMSSVKQGRIILGQPAKDELGGIGLFSTPADFAKLLSALLDGGRTLLSKASVDILFQPQLSDKTRAAMPKPLGAQTRRVLGIGSLDHRTQADHCLAGTVTLKDIPGRRRAGSISWSGLPNLHWVNLPSPLSYYPLP